MPPVPVRFVDATHVLMSNGWVVRGVCVCEQSHARLLSRVLRCECGPSSCPWLPAHTPYAQTTRLRPSPMGVLTARSVRYNDLDGAAKKHLQDAAGDRVTLQL